ncbi:HI_0552 family protein [Streptococcus dentasini]
MYEKLNAYLAYQGFKYVKPEKAGPLAGEMTELKVLGQGARSEFTGIAKHLADKVAPFEMTRVSNWANQAQVARPHFWCYFKQPQDHPDDVGLAIRLYGQKDDFGISVEVSFVERKKSEDTLSKQNKILTVPIAEPLYYFAQEDGVSHKVEGNEENRSKLQEAVESGTVQKVLVKYDIPIEMESSLDSLTDQLVLGFDRVLPYYDATKS